MTGGRFFGRASRRTERQDAARTIRGVLLGVGKEVEEGILCLRGQEEDEEIDFPLGKLEEFVPRKSNQKPKSSEPLYAAAEVYSRRWAYQ